MAYGQKPKCYIIAVHAAKLLNIFTIQNYYVGEGSQTRTMSVRTLQAYGNGKGVPLTDNAEGEKIVEAL